MTLFIGSRAATFDDAGPISHTNSSCVRIFYSLLGIGSEKETRYLMCTMLKVEEGEDKSWELIMASFEQLARECGLEDWSGMLLFLGADLDYVCNMLGLPHFNSNDMCHCCLANKSTMPYNNFHPSAGWQTTEVDNTAFKDRVRRPLHPLVCHAWFTKYAYRHCMIHMIDHHGVASHVAAHIIWQHMGGDRECNALPGNNIEERLHFFK